MDSMSLYRRMDIGTAKARPELRRRVPHHLIDLIEPWAEFSLACYLAAAHEVAGQLRVRGRLPLFVGGTPLYLICLLRGVEAGPLDEIEDEIEPGDELEIELDFEQIAEIEYQ